MNFNFPAIFLNGNIDGLNFYLLVEFLPLPLNFQTHGDDGLLYSSLNNKFREFPAIANLSNENVILIKVLG